MIDVSKHIVEKFNLEFNTLSEDQGKQLERQSVDLFQQKLLPEIEKIFNRYGTSQNIRLEKLALEIDVKDSSQFEEQFVNQFLDQLSKELENASNNHPKSKNEVEDLFQHFLENGHFPWWAQEHSLEELEKQLLQKNKTSFSISEVLQNDPEKLKRLVFQFGDALLENLINDQNLKNFISDLQTALSKYSTKTEVRNQVWQFVFEAIIFKNLTAEQSEIYIFKTSVDHFSERQKTSKARIDSKTEFSESILKEFKNLDEDLFLKLQVATQSITLKEKSVFLKPKAISENKPENKLEVKSDQKEWYIQNAGIVLLHPFLVMLFESLGYVVKNVFKDSHSQNQAALLLQYLATGVEQSPENELIMNKLLCNIPLIAPIENELILNEKIITETEQLLNAVIKHWSAIKNTSPEGLRNSFLQREGKLTKSNDGSWKLLVQHTTFDILISKLPWSISIIKLPWMKNMLQVEWA